MLFMEDHSPKNLIQTLPDKESFTFMKEKEIDPVPPPKTVENFSIPQKI
jgi:hypothetical protein